MNLPASSSDLPDDPSEAYERLHPRMREWVWNQGWDRLRPTQVKSIRPILACEQDVLITAATGTGKTEAAWLPICSTLAQDRDGDLAQLGIKALYISPLKALINDQFERLETMFGCIDLPAARRHGDVSGAERYRIVTSPDGLLLITPESLEALFVHQGPRIPVIFNGLRYIVVDELHSFIGTERGAQLQSLLHRIEMAIRRRVPRIALSATIADTRIAADFLRPGDGGSAVIIDGKDEQQAELRMQLRGHVIFASPPQPQRDDGMDVDDDGESDLVNQAITDHLFRTLRGSDNLVFANSRQNVELYADRLRLMSDRQRVPNEFHPHHGSLSKELREDVERKLKATDEHATAVCTSTLEMGIDIGTADSIAQIGAPASVSALRQRLGRSGRRGGAAVLRIYVTETELEARTPPVDQLRADTVQAIAVVELLLEQWFEPPNSAGLHLSTLIQQLLSVIAQHGGASAVQLYSGLCSDGPFRHVSQAMFMHLLRDLAAADLIVQSADGMLLPGAAGELLINHYTFFAAFQTQEEFRLVADGRTLGSMPIEHSVMIGNLLVFAGRRWIVLGVDQEAKIIELRRSRGGRPPIFGGLGPEVADGIRKRMKAVYEDSSVPPYLDTTGRRLLDEGRKSYRRLALERSPLLPWGADTIIFPWRGDRVMNTLSCLLRTQGLNVSHDGVALTCTDATGSRVLAAVDALSTSARPSASDVARHVLVKARDKHDIYLGEELLNASYAARDLDLDAVWDSLLPVIESGS